MAKQQMNFRLSEEATASAAALAGVWGYEGRTDAVEASLACWEMSLALAGAEAAGRFTPAEWGMIADVCNGTAWAYGHTGARPGMILAAEVEDGHRLDGKGYDWLGEPDLPGGAFSPAARAEADGRAKELCEKLLAIDYAGAWAVIRAVCWFWQRPEVGMDQPWWEPGFRREWKGGGDAETA